MEPNLWIGLIMVIVPVLIAGLKAFLPKVPKAMLPILAPILGAAVDIGLYYAGAAAPGTVWAMALGSAGVGLREVVDQLKKAVA